ncbi:SRPBCC family protein [Micromonospora aurantiaca (nom. illeg.)]|uniref:SRPBCC family protein n=1 Tax=Micromonospora aurantiaca (nom. illeg.) TaxID=47850 RepID=UPI000A8E0707|nr:SRPBCC family protein [Micromonospora aurantiaca]
MRFAESVDIAADVERVWEVQSDVERWPEWTPSVTAARRLEPGPLLLGSTARLEQPGCARPCGGSWRSVRRTRSPGSRRAPACAPGVSTG